MVSATTCIVFLPLIAIQVRIVCHRLFVSTAQGHLDRQDLLSKTENDEVHRQSTLVLPDQFRGLIRLDGLIETPQYVGLQLSADSSPLDKYRLTRIARSTRDSTITVIKSILHIQLDGVIRLQNPTSFFSL